jgi:PTS system N-acetylglucosamine-specific IIC component
MLIGIAFTSFLTGITEPIEFTFMFLAPFLYVIHALLTASSMVIVYLLDIKHGFGFSAGAIDFFLNWGIAQQPLLLLIIGLAYGAVYFFVFYFLIRTFNLKTPGREDEENIIEEKGTGEDKYSVMARNFIDDIGGKENIAAVDYCTTRLRLTIKDMSKVQENSLKQHGAKGVIKVNQSNLQIIVGTDVQFVGDKMKG